MIDQRDIFLAGKNVSLKSLTEADITESNWYGWLNDEAMTAGTQHHIYPNSVYHQLAFLRNLQESKSIIQLGIVPIGLDKIVGIVSLKNINLISRTADHAQMIEKQYRTINLFLESNKLILDHAFYALGLNRINGGSIDQRQTKLMCRFFGFKEEGISRSAVFKDGNYVDIHRIGLLKAEYSPVLLHRV
jgi:RimJ/RimL family protein N-acetyltransferase